jgi:hypothetical protein
MKVLNRKYTLSKLVNTLPLNVVNKTKIFYLLLGFWNVIPVPASKLSFNRFFDLPLNHRECLHLYTYLPACLHTIHCMFLRLLKSVFSVISAFRISSTSVFLLINLNSYNQQSFRAFNPTAPPYLQHSTSMSDYHMFHPTFQHVLQFQIYCLVY